MHLFLALLVLSLSPICDAGGLSQVDSSLKEANGLQYEYGEAHPRNLFVPKSSTSGVLASLESVVSFVPSDSDSPLSEDFEQSGPLAFMIDGKMIKLDDIVDKAAVTSIRTAINTVLAKSDQSSVLTCVYHGGSYIRSSKGWYKSACRRTVDRSVALVELNKDAHKHSTNKYIIYVSPDFQILNKVASIAFLIFKLLIDWNAFVRKFRTANCQINILWVSRIFGTPKSKCAMAFIDGIIDAYRDTMLDNFVFQLYLSNDYKKPWQTKLDMHRQLLGTDNAKLLLNQKVIEGYVPDDVDHAQLACIYMGSTMVNSFAQTLLNDYEGLSKHRLILFMEEAHKLSLSSGGIFRCILLPEFLSKYLKNICAKNVPIDFDDLSTVVIVHFVNTEQFSNRSPFLIYMPAPRHHHVNVTGYQRNIVYTQLMEAYRRIAFCMMGAVVEWNMNFNEGITVLYFYDEDFALDLFPLQEQVLCFGKILTGIKDFWVSQGSMKGAPLLYTPKKKLDIAFSYAMGIQMSYQLQLESMYPLQFAAAIEFMNGIQYETTPFYDTDLGSGVPTVAPVVAGRSQLDAVLKSLNLDSNPETSINLMVYFEWIVQNHLTQWSCFNLKEDRNLYKTLHEVCDFICAGPSTFDKANVYLLQFISKKILLYVDVDSVSYTGMPMDQFDFFANTYYSVGRCVEIWNTGYPSPSNPCRIHYIRPFLPTQYFEYLVDPSVAAGAIIKGLGPNERFPVSPQTYRVEFPFEDKAFINVWCLNSASF